MFERATAEDQILHTNKRSVKEQFNNMDKIGFDALIDFFEVQFPSFPVTFWMDERAKWQCDVCLRFCRRTRIPGSSW